MTMTPIKNCPHCGGPARLHQRYARQMREYMIFVKCDICGAQGKIYNTEQEASEIDWTGTACSLAAAAWNMRYPEEPSAAAELATIQDIMRSN